MCFTGGKWKFGQWEDGQCGGRKVAVRNEQRKVAD